MRMVRITFLLGFSMAVLKCSKSGYFYCSVCSIAYYKADKFHELRDYYRRGNNGHRPGIKLKFVDGPL